MHCSLNTGSCFCKTSNRVRENTYSERQNKHLGRANNASSWRDNGSNLRFETPPCALASRATPFTRVRQREANRFGRFRDVARIKRNHSQRRVLEEEGLEACLAEFAQNREVPVSKFVRKVHATISVPYGAGTLWSFETVAIGLRSNIGWPPYEEGFRNSKGAGDRWAAMRWASSRG